MIQVSLFIEQELERRKLLQLVKREGKGTMLSKGRVCKTKLVTCKEVERPRRSIGTKRSLLNYACNNSSTEY